jgi:hypothetical protein
MTTKTHGTTDDQYQFSSRIPSNIAERLKRKRSLDEKTENKRDRVDTVTDEEEDLNESEKMAGSNDNTGGRSKNLADELLLAMSDEKVMNMLSTAFAKKIIEDVNSKIDEVEKRVIVTEKRGDTFDQRIDNFEQRDLDLNVIISGVSNGKTSKDEVRKVLNDKLKCNVASTDIRYTMKMNGGEDEKSNVKVAFTTKDKKKQVMQSKKKLKGDDMWISDDLTPYRRNLAYLARRAVKGGKAAQTWVTDGKIFLKKNGKDKPEKITSAYDIPGFSDT